VASGEGLGGRCEDCADFWTSIDGLPISAPNCTEVTRISRLLLVSRIDSSLLTKRFSLSCKVSGCTHKHRSIYFMNSSLLRHIYSLIRISPSGITSGLFSAWISTNCQQAEDRVSETLIYLPKAHCGRKLTQSRRESIIISCMSAGLLGDYRDLVLLCLNLVRFT
jgi:hypothetical protein